MMRLAIWAGRDRVGTLTHDRTHHLFDFLYDDAWLSDGARYPLSPQMPLIPDGDRPGVQPFHMLPAERRSAIARAFFQNLLPEGQALEVAAQANGLGKGNLAGLLLALGAETAGALRVSAVDAAPVAAGVSSAGHPVS